MQKLSLEQLKLYNYTDEQIYTIYNFDESEEMITAAISTVKVYGGFTSNTHNSTKSTAKLVMAFNWNGRTSGYGKDIFVVT